MPSSVRVLRIQNKQNRVILPAGPSADAGKRRVRVESVRSGSRRRGNLVTV